jgi:putative Mg2+ transporter-C (MgtC) family protein
LALIFLKQLEPLIQKDRYLHLSITANAEPDIYPTLEKLFAERKLRISDIEADLDLATQCIRYRFIITQHKERIGRELSQIIAEIDGVKKIHYQ